MVFAFSKFDRGVSVAEMTFAQPLVNALILVLIISAIPLGASMVVGLFVSILQAATQIQEMTLSFVPKLLTIFLVLFLFGDWMSQQIVEFCQAMIVSAGTI